MKRKRAERPGSGPGAAPALPFRLRKELGYGGGAPEKAGRPRRQGVSMFRVTQRREARKAARHGAAPPAKQGKRRPALADAGGDEPLAKRARHSAGPQLKKEAKRQPRTKFQELLDATTLQSGGQRGMDAELALQRSLAKKLGLKGAAAKRSARSMQSTPESASGPGKAQSAKQAQEAAAEGFALLDGLEDEGEASGGQPGSQASGGSSSPASDSELSGSDASEGDSQAGSSDDEEDGLPPGLLQRDGADEEQSSLGSEGSLGLPAEDSDGLSDGDSGEEAAAAAGKGSMQGKGSRQAMVEPDSDSEEDAGRGQQTGQEAKRALAGQRYVPPGARLAAAGGDGDALGMLRRRVKGLLNRLTEASLRSTAEALAGLAEGPLGWRALADAAGAELLQAATQGPRATERFAAVSAAVMAGLAALLRNPAVGANFAAALAGQLEVAREAADSLACANLGQLAAQLYAAGLLPSEALYSLLAHLQERLGEGDVAVLQTVLTAVGFRLRSADPAAMKGFVVGLHARAAAASAQGALSKRSEVLLGLVMDIKNNRRRAPKGAALPQGGRDPSGDLLGPAAAQWLAGLKSGCAGQLRALTWARLLAPDKKGEWWLPQVKPGEGLGSLLRGPQGAALDIPQGAELLQLATAQRFTTEDSRAVFCVLLGSQDYVEASGRLLQLPLKGEGERAVMRVALEVALREGAWNPYYGHVLGRLAAARRGHRATLQFALWDAFKRLEAEPARRLGTLASLVAHLLAAAALPPTLLKVVDFQALTGPADLLFWRLVFRDLLCRPDAEAVATKVFGQLAGQRPQQGLRRALGAFLAGSFFPWAGERGAPVAPGVRRALAAALAS